MINFFRFLYPRRCPFCDMSLAPGELEAGICKLCLKKLNRAKDFSDKGKSLYEYESVKTSIYRFKYMNRPEYARVYGREMAKAFSEWLSDINPDALVPVPIHTKRLIKRGYNQATELAEAISAYTNIPVRAHCIERTKNTIPLKLLNRENRVSNLKKAFIVIENVVNLRRVVLIDDIYTTGATINALETELKKAGVKEVYFLTLSKAGEK